MKRGQLFKLEFNEVTDLKDWRRRHVSLGPKTLSVTVNSSKGADSNNDEHHELEYINVVQALPCRDCTACRRLKVSRARVYFQVSPVFFDRFCPGVSAEGRDKIPRRM
jgi:hypothetical protein